MHGRNLTSLLATGLLAASLLATAGAARAATYYFATLGSDANDGRSPSTPMRSLERVPSLLTPGTTVLLHRGDVWFARGLRWDIAAAPNGDAAPMRIGAYGESSRPRPIIADMRFVSRESFRSEGGELYSTAWDEAGAGTEVLGVALAGTRLSRASEPAALAPGTFAIHDGRLWIRSAAMPDAPGIGVLGRSEGSLLHARGTAPLTVADLDLRGGRGWSSARVGGGAGAVTFENVAMTVLPPEDPYPMPHGPLQPGIYYFSSTRGSDLGGNGTQDHPWYNVNWFTAQMQPGVTLLLERGSVWYYTGVTWDFAGLHGSAGQPMRIGTYGNPASPRPVVAMMQKFPRASWQDAGVPGRYSHAQTPDGTIDKVWRLYVNGSPLPKVPGLAELVNGTYCVVSGVIYVQSTDVQNGADVELIPATSSYYLIRADNTAYLTVEGLELKGATAWSMIRATGSTDHLTFRDLFMHQFRNYGIDFGLENLNDPNSLHTNVLIENCTIDKGWTEAMNHEFPHIVAVDTTWNNGMFEDGPGGDGVDLGYAVDGATVRGCYVTNMGHSGIQSEYDVDNNVPYGVRNVLIEQNVVTAGTSCYCRALGFGGMPQNTHATIRRNYLHDMNISTQITGDGVWVYSNIFENTYRAPHRDAATPLDSYVIYQAPRQPGTTVRNVVFANNTITNGEAVFRMRRGAQNDGYMCFNNKFVGNIASTWRPKADSYDGVTVTLTGAVVIDTAWIDQWTIKNNGFWNGSPDDLVMQVMRANQVIDNYTATTLNLHARCSGNVTANPLFMGGTDPTAKFALSRNSPYVLAGLPLSQVLPAGVDPVDFYGRPFAPTPSAGAIQFQWIAVTGAAISGAPAGVSGLGSPISLSSALTPADGDAATYAWEVWVGGAQVASSSAPNFIYSPTSPGTYTFKLMVVDRWGSTFAATPVQVSVAQLPHIELYDATLGTALASGAATTHDVIANVFDVTTKSATRNGSAIAWPANNRFTAEGAYVITATGATVVTATFTIDRTAPVITGVANNAFVNTNVQLTFNEGTGMLNGTPFTSGWSVSEDGSYTLVVTDAAGNASSVTFTIDTMIPAIKFQRKINGNWVNWSPSGAQPWSSGGYDIRVQYTEPNFDHVTLTKNNLAMTWTGNPMDFTQVGTYVLTVYDRAGNWTRVSYKR